jgi:hypothetical protein
MTVPVEDSNASNMLAATQQDPNGDPIPVYAAALVVDGVATPISFGNPLPVAGSVSIASDGSGAIKCGCSAQMLFGASCRSAVISSATTARIRFTCPMSAKRPSGARQSTSRRTPRLSRRPATRRSKRSASMVRPPASPLRRGFGDVLARRLSKQRSSRRRRSVSMAGLCSGAGTTKSSGQWRMK